MRDLTKYVKEADMQNRIRSLLSSRLKVGETAMENADSELIRVGLDHLISTGLNNISKLEPSCNYNYASASTIAMFCLANWFNPTDETEHEWSRLKQYSTIEKRKRNYKGLWNIARRFFLELHFKSEKFVQVQDLRLLAKSAEKMHMESKISSLLQLSGNSEEGNLYSADSSLPGYLEFCLSNLPSERMNSTNSEIITPAFLWERMLNLCGGANVSEMDFVKIMGQFFGDKSNANIFLNSYCDEFTKKADSSEKKK